MSMKTSSFHQLIYTNIITPLLFSALFVHSFLFWCCC